MFEKLEKRLRELNHNGIPLPMVTDPRTDQGSVSLTLVFISSFFVELSLLSNAFGKVTVDPNNALMFFGMCCSLYFGRSLIKKNDKGQIEITSDGDTSGAQDGIK